MNLIKCNKELKNFYLFLIGQFVSEFGSRMTSYGLILWAYCQSKSVLSTSLLTICYLIPSVLLSFISGSISDSWNKKKIMLIADSVANMFSIIVLVLLLTRSLKIEYIYFINFMLGISDSFQNPASEVTVSLLISKENYIKTSGLRSFCNSFINVFAPMVTTAIYSFCGLIVIVNIDILTFVFAFVTLAFKVNIPKVQENGHSKSNGLYKECKAGIAYLVNKKDIFYLIMFMGFVNFIAAIYNSNLTPMVLSRNDNNKIQLGIVNSVIGIALLYVCSGILGFAGCCIFRLNKDMRKLNEE